MKWSPWAAGVVKRLHVKVNQFKLEGFCEQKVEDDGGDGDEDDDKIVVIAMKWKGPKAGLGLVPFYRTSTRQRDYTNQRCSSNKGQPIEWDDEFESVCSFSISKDGSFGPWDVTFDVLYGQKTESRSKLSVLGKVSLNLGELASNMKSHQIERELPVTLRDGRLSTDATLLVSMSFVEVRDSHESPRITVNFVESDTVNVSVTKLKSGLNTRLESEKENNKNQKAFSGNYLDMPAVTDSDGSSESIYTSDNSNVDLTLVADLESFSRSKTLSRSFRKTGFFSWKRRRLSFKSFGSLRKADAAGSSSEIDLQDDNCTTSDWEVKELVSRDGQAKLKTNVFLASFDQRSEKASGESACTTLVTVIAHWLHSNQDMPTRPKFDSLIIEGSSEWQKLCNNTAYIQSFPDKHFDLHTVLEAKFRPLAVLHEKSFIGFFCPEKFECLKEAMSFEDIWNKISSNTEVYEPRIYIVSWNDHFFVLKVEADAYYIIDTLGERLFEGCNQAFILKFDDSSVMREKEEKEKVGSKEKDGARSSDHKEETEKVICSGKECCKEFIRRFLAAIPLRELEEEEKKATISNYSLHQRLQIEFDLCCSSSSSSSTSISSQISNQ
ncbi:uncharacterized protein LOC115974944 isoform X1 [Quercus lobata]|uniref:C2 NT-type domain-containing protein n=1 Tax=Quercus lobata TaxID=97700 RepID=A0A7N2QYN8_QUELO|nr:uncharacterized protein LOC115974944 isoform X1 [Quercus lobata]